jgi:hypothetical protein
MNRKLSGERQQLEMARQEMKLSEMELLSGTSPLQWGRWARADWVNRETS